MVKELNVSGMQNGNQLQAIKHGSFLVDRQLRHRDKWFFHWEIDSGRVVFEVAEYLASQYLSLPFFLVEILHKGFHPVPDFHVPLGVVCGL